MYDTMMEMSRTFHRKIKEVDAVSSDQKSWSKPTKAHTLHEKPVSVVTDAETVLW